MRLAAQPRFATRRHYVERVNLAIDYIVGRLSRPLRLAEVSRAAGLSPFHFHRVFQAMVGETLADFIKRLRLEKALVTMAHGPRRSLTDVALDCGFSSSSDFSRSFRQRYGVAPSRFDLRAWREEHGAELEAVVPERLHLSGAPAAPNPDHFRVRLRDLPARTVAYIRILDPYRGGVFEAAQRLMAWAERRGFADNQWLGYQRENPEITKLEHCQYHVAVEADDFSPRGEIGRFRFPPMTVAQIEIRGDIALELRALYWLYGAWLPKSGYIPDDQPAFESWIGRPFAHGNEYFEIHIQLPVRRA